MTIEIKTTPFSLSIITPFQPWEKLSEETKAHLEQAAAKAGFDCARAYDALATAVLGFGQAAQQTASAINTVALDLYREHHRRLPGTLRTTRGRKKRETKVLAWFQRYLKQLPRK